ncbi:hypothetical protein GQ42DRAFT_169048 [Ramicandelaber brevisporus]|nr:hypothetical protein GQ42DRAFT_169048 [Ramicandelaber brevisporus]
MRFTAIFAVAAAFTAGIVAAEDAKPTPPPSVDANKPDTVKSYFSSIAKELNAVEPKVVTLLPKEQQDTAKTFMEVGVKLAELVVASVTEPTLLSPVVTQLATVEQEVKKMSSDPAAYASSIKDNFDAISKSAAAAAKSLADAEKSAGKGKGNAAMSDVSVSAARLAVGAIAGTAAFAILF